MIAMTLTGHPLRTVVGGKQGATTKPPVVTIGAGGTTMTDAEEVAGIMAIELVIKARAGAEGGVATRLALQLW